MRLPLVTKIALVPKGIYRRHKNYEPNFLNVTRKQRAISTIKDNGNNKNITGDQNATVDRPRWNDEWKRIGLGAEIIQSLDNSDHDNKGKSEIPLKTKPIITNLLFVQTGFGVDQHGHRLKDGATKAATRAVRNAIEFNSIPGVIEAVPGGRNNMLIQVLLGVPPADCDVNYNKSNASDNDGLCKTIEPMKVDLAHVAKVFPYGKLLPIQIKLGGLAFPTGRIVSELGDEDDTAICVAACVSIGYDSREKDHATDMTTGHGTSKHKTYDTRDGF